MKSSQEFEARTLEADGLRQFLEANNAGGDWPRVNWDLNALTLAAFYYHPDLDVARAKWAVAEAGKRTAGESPNPTLSVTPAYDTTTAIPSPWIVTASLDIPIETGGKRGYRLAQARHLSKSARLNIASLAWAVRSRLRQRLLDLYTAREMEKLLKDQQSLQAENLRLVEGQAQAGAISAFELTQARIAADTTRLALRDAERQSAEAYAQLANAIGVPAAALEKIQLSFSGFNDLPADVPGDDARRQALLNRADVLASLSDYAASQSALQLEIAKQYPDIHLSPGYEFDQGDNKWSLGLTVTLPVINQNKGAIGEAAAHRNQAAAEFNALQSGVIGDIEKALAGYRASIQKRSDIEMLRTNLLKQEKTAKSMLEAGETSKADLVGLQLQLSASELSRLDALTKSQQALGQLEDALQSPLGLSPSVWEKPPRLPETKKVAAHP
jgi:outer membrane protein TolC